MPSRRNVALVSVAVGSAFKLPVKDKEGAVRIIAAAFVFIIVGLSEANLGLEAGWDDTRFTVGFINISVFEI